MKNSEVWELIYKEADTLYNEYLEISSFEELVELSNVVQPEPAKAPNYDVQLLLGWN
jgi:hypothetical protein